MCSCFTVWWFFMFSLCVCVYVCAFRSESTRVLFEQWLKPAREISNQDAASGCMVVGHNFLFVYRYVLHIELSAQKFSYSVCVSLFSFGYSVYLIISINMDAKWWIWMWLAMWAHFVLMLYEFLWIFHQKRQWKPNLFYSEWMHVYIGSQRASVRWMRK